MKKEYAMCAAALALFLLQGTLFSYNFDKFEVFYKRDVRSLPENSVRTIVESTLKSILEIDPYYKAMSHVYSNGNNEPQFLITYLLRSDILRYESYKINLDKLGNVLSVQEHFEDPDAEEDSRECNTCPDPETEVYVESSMDGTPLGAAEWVYSVALGAGYKTMKDIQGAATSTRYKQFLTCPKLKCVVHVGHGNNEKGILFAQDDIQYPWFAALPKDYMVEQVHMYGSCLIQNDPFKSAFMGTGVEAFMGGKSTIDINTLQNTMFAIANGIFYKKEVKASFEASDARSKGWDISGNPPNGPWYVDKAITLLNFIIPRPQSQAKNIVCSYSRNTGALTISWPAGKNQDIGNREVSIAIYSIEGTFITDCTDEHKKLAFDKVQVNVSNLATGVYIVTLTSGGNTLSSRTILGR